MSESTDYPFLDDWERVQQEPDYPGNGSSLFRTTEPSPLAIDRLPERRMPPSHGKRCTKDLTVKNERRTK